MATPLPTVLHSRTALDRPLPLDSGAVLARPEIAFEAYGSLNEARDNVILICHALTMDQYVASTHPLTGKPGWWGKVVPGSGSTNKSRSLPSRSLPCRAEPNTRGLATR